MLFSSEFATTLKNRKRHLWTACYDPFPLTQTGPPPGSMVTTPSGADLITNAWGPGPPASGHHCPGARAGLGQLFQSLKGRNIMAALHSFHIPRVSCFPIVLLLQSPERAKGMAARLQEKKNQNLWCWVAAKKIFSKKLKAVNANTFSCDKRWSFTRSIATTITSRGKASSTLSRSCWKSSR